VESPYRSYLAIRERSILTSIKASKRETEIAIAVSMKKNMIIFFLSGSEYFFHRKPPLLSGRIKAVLMFTKLKQAINNINKPIPENMYHASLVYTSFFHQYHYLCLLLNKDEYHLFSEDTGPTESQIV